MSHAYCWSKTVLELLEDHVRFSGSQRCSWMRDAATAIEQSISRFGGLGTSILPTSLNSQADARFQQPRAQLADLYTTLSLDARHPTRIHLRHTRLIYSIKYQNQAFESLRHYISRKERGQTSTGSDLLSSTQSITRSIRYENHAFETFKR